MNIALKKVEDCLSFIEKNQKLKGLKTTITGWV